MDFNAKSYELHRQLYNQVGSDTAEQWKREDTVDYWRHKRMYDTLLPLLNNYPDRKWLTIGDGKFGTDAHYLLKYTPHVLATDIAEDCLKMARECGYIPEYQIENAEHLSFPDNSFDFVLTKEAYHHFPRPAIAVYEMLRVARNAVILIEPNDPNCITPQNFDLSTGFFWFVQSIKNRIKQLLNKDIYYSQGNYEPAGNFVYAISEREIEKMALGLNYDMVAFKGINDEYIEGAENELLKDKGPIYNNIQQVIDAEDEKVRKGKRVYSILTAIIFKEMPDEACIRDMEKDGYKITRLMKNPYI